MTTALTAILNALSGAGSAPIVSFRGQSLSGDDVLARIRARAADLHGAGLGVGDTALIVVSDNLTAIEQLLALWWLGAAGCLVDFRATPQRIAEWCDRLGPRLVLGARPMAGVALHLQPHGLQTGAEGLPEPVADPDLRALYRSSSGSTGLPSLHPVAQGPLLASLQEMVGWAGEWGVWPEGVPCPATLGAVSVGYAASAYQWLRNLLAAKPIVALDLVYGLNELDHALQRPDVTEAALPPAILRRLAALSGDRLPRYPNLRRLISVGGPALAADKLAAVTRLSPSYVMTYSCVGVGLIARITGPEVLARPDSCGRPLPPVVVEIRNGDRLCPIGEIGEIVVTAAHVTAIRPGDMGWLDAEGYLYVTGRKQGLLCRNGVNFSAERLTEAALGFAKVQEAAVIALPDADGGDEIHLVVQAPDHLAPDDLTPHLAQHLRQCLPASEQPDHLHLWPRLPLTAAGKVDQRALAQWMKEPGNDVFA